MLVLILLHGFFVAGEFALIASDRTRIENLAREGDRRAKSALAALKSLSFQLSGAQLGITITSLVVGFLTEPVIAPVIRPALEAVGMPESSSLPVAIAIGLALATVIEMVFAELVPKNLAIAKPVELGLAIATPMRLYNKIFKPIILFLNAAANWTVRRFGVQPREELIGVRSLDELQMLIYSSKEHGTLGKEEFSLLARSISFGGKTAADALVPRVQVVAIKQTETLDRLTQLAIESGHSRIPVYNDDLDDVIGLAHVMDIYRFAPGERSKRTVSEVTREALVVPESTSLERLLTRMRRERQQLAVVIDEYGGTAGIVTIEDLLEEIVGEIEDEYDADDRQQTSPVEGVHRVSGMLRPDELQESTGFVIPEGDYDTLAGFLLFLFDRIPEKGEQVSHQGWEFKVVDKDRNRISEVLMIAPSQNDVADAGEEIEQ